MSPLAFMPAKSLYSWLYLRDPMDCSPPGSSIHGIFQARVLEWVAVSFSKNSEKPVVNQKMSTMRHPHPHS